MTWFSHDTKVGEPLNIFYCSWFRCICSLGYSVCWLGYGRVQYFGLLCSRWLQLCAQTMKWEFALLPNIIRLQRI